MVESRSKTQALIALSSGESKLYATLEASAETLGIISMLTDFGLSVTGEIWCDAQAALGIIKMNGLGKIRHIPTGLLWVQQISAQQRLSFGKVLGTENPADLFTKYLDQGTIEQHLQRLGCEIIEGRADEAPKLHNVSMSMDEYNLVGVWKPWEWLDVITCAIEYKSAKIQKFKQGNVFKGELNIINYHT